MSPPTIDATARIVESATGREATGSGLSRRVAARVDTLTGLPAGPVFAPMESSLAAVLRYLAARAAGRPFLPYDPATPATRLLDLLRRFAPGVLVWPASAAAPPPADGYRLREVPGWGPCLLRISTREAPDPHRALGLLLLTSGSTGTPRLVRLSATGVAANAAAIAEALDISRGDVAVTALPLFYTYGLSVLVSHLFAGATVVLSTANVTEHGFWADVSDHGGTSLALVPSQYEMLFRLRWRPEFHPTLRSMASAGGRLGNPLAARFHRAMSEVDGRLYVMYGQTEAGPRITVLPPHRLPAKLGAVGLPLSGVRLGIRTGDGGETTEPGRTGEVICHSPGVMLGYAETAADLSAEDQLRGTLRTGDLGRLDDDGYLWLSGRMNRIGKVFGVRVDLDAVERLLGTYADTAAVAHDDRIRVWCAGVPASRRGELAELVTDRLRVHHAGVELSVVDELPRLPSGKTDYHAVENAP
jgi:acyl-coenzyme A synthetase/AMP-(fatty) acid ligase